MRKRFLYFLLPNYITFLVAFLAVSMVSFAQAPDEINVSGCNNPNFNGNYDKVASLCNGCAQYEKIGGGVFLYRYSDAHNEFWSATTASVNCLTVFEVIQSGETDCDPTNGGVPANGCMISEGLALPVELLSFTARPQENSIQLKWRVANETNNAGFEVQRSTDGRSFEFVNFVRGRGTATSPRTYLFRDSDVVPQQRYYYRLRQIDLNGYYEYSEIVTAELKATESYLSAFYPNPANTHTSVEFYNPEPTNWTIAFYDLSGKLIFKELRSLDSGMQNLSFDLTGFQNGLYLVQFESADLQFCKKLFIRH